LIAAALVNRPDWSDRFTNPLVAFGVFNVLFAAPGTEWVRGAAIIGSLAALVFPLAFLGPVVTIAVLTWPPAFGIAWALAHDRRDESDGMGARIAMATVIAAVAIAAIAYRLI